MMSEQRRGPARTIMVQGTASDVGKSIITTALCRILSEDGFRVAPFKSQNMSLNSYVTWDGKEIGRAQGMQADACGILATTDMNPILLKPKKDMVSQVIIHGKPLGDYEAKVYRGQVLAEAKEIVTDSLANLRAAYDIVVLEGAGSPAEINLKDRDIVNMQAAAWADAPVVLVADIDRGGMFASIVGTLELLEPHERDRICGFIVNKFRGDVSLLTPGLDWLEAKTGKPVLGVVPYLPELGLEDEDSMSLDSKLRAEPYTNNGKRDKRIDLAVIRLPHISNFSDIDPFYKEEDVSVRYVTAPQQWGAPDAVIIPGSKNVVDDLHYLRKSGLADLLERYRKSGGHIVGICGGYEMLGRRLHDPFHTESDEDVSDGLGWFPFDVVFAPEKRTVRVEGKADIPGLEGEYPVEGYEIHMGSVDLAALDELEMSEGEHDRSHPWTRPFRLRAIEEENAAPEGISSLDGHVWGTFLHGVMHNDELRRAWVNRLRSGLGWEPLPVTVHIREMREQSFRRLSEHVRSHVDMKRLKAAMGISEGGPL